MTALRLAAASSCQRASIGLGTELQQETLGLPEAACVCVRACVCGFVRARLLACAGLSGNSV